MSTFTTSLNLELVARGDFVGTWDTPENSNWELVDTALGGQTTVPLVGSNVILSQSQYKNNLITFTGALTASIQIQVPAIGRLYTVQNLTTNSSIYNVVLTTASTSPINEYIGIPPNQTTDVICDGFHVRFRNLPQIGTYHDLAAYTLPLWNAGCFIPPYLNCDGTSFSSATYPVLATMLGGTTLPDARGRFRGAYNAGTGRLASGLTYGINGDVILSGGGNYYNQLATAHLPAYTPTGSVSTPTGSVSTPTGSVSTPTGSVSTPTGSVSTPTGSVSLDALNLAPTGLNAVGGAVQVLIPSGGVAPVSQIGTLTFAGNPVSFTGNAVSFTGNAVSFTGNPVSFTGNAATFTGNAQGGVSSPLGTVPPSYIGGITMIRAG